MDELAFQLLVVHGEADEKPVARLLELLEPRPATLARGLKLPELAGVLERCALFVGNDSGITHIAAAVGAPTIALFGPASPAVWQPTGDNVSVIRFGEHDVAEARRAIERCL